MSDGRISRILAISLASSILLVNQCFATSATAKASKASKSSKSAKTLKKEESRIEEKAAPAQPTAAPKTMATSYSLGGTERYLTMLSTDKPIYRAGDKLYLRGVMLNAANKQPQPSSIYFKNGAILEIKGPKGEVLATGAPLLKDSVWSYVWDIPSHTTGGEYTAYLSFPHSQVAPAERKFDVRSFRNTRLKSQITFVRDGYAPGEKVSAILDVKRAEGGIPAGAAVAVTATIDGVAINGPAATVDEKGLCRVSFDLPTEISRGDGTLALVITDGGIVETASKTIPILLKTVDLQMYPEGGDLLAGHKNRVYLEAMQTNGKPADLVGKIMMSGSNNESPQVVADVRTEHEGRGRFEFVPQLGKNYYLAISEPSGIKQTFPLPEAKEKGAIITTEQDTYSREEPVVLRTASTEETYKVSLYKREIKIADYKVKSQNLNVGELQRVQFNLPDDIDGVLTATIWSADGKPLAERLIFREVAKPINISIKPAKKVYVPGETAELIVKATDEQGKPLSTVVGLTVTDETVIEMIDKREQSPSLPVMFFLEPEVKNLADAHVYLDPRNPKAPLATDLLLGTQGWRRFAFLEPKAFVDKYGDRARRALAGFQNESANRLISHRIGEIGVNKRADSQGQLEKLSSVDRYTFFPSVKDSPILKLPEEIGRVEGPRDMNLFQVEPTVLDERYYTTGRAERHQKTSPTLPEGAPIPDGYPSETWRRYQRIAQQQSRDVYVREYAHKSLANRLPNDRKDFTETLYWNAGVKTDAETGEAKIAFALSDNVTTFRVSADAFSESGGIGANSIGLQSQQAFYTEAKLPTEVTSGDEILVPVNFVNTTDGALESPVATVDVEQTGSAKRSTFKKFDTALGAGERSRLLQSIAVGTTIGNSTVTVSTKAGDYHDKVTRQINVTSNGFPAEQNYAGMLTAGGTIVNAVNVPAFVPGSLTVSAVAYPAPLGNLTQALECLIREPYGCFEQTSATSYPLTMAQQYFLTHSNVDPKFIEDSRKKLDTGYKKLVSYWCPDRGFEWFGQNPGHETLTAFGLMHFNDMKKVREVDQDMLDITRAWLMRQRDGKGGFSQNRRHSGWAESPACSNAYIVWALLECGQPADSLKNEIAWIKKDAQTNSNSYVTALAANVLYLAGDKLAAKDLMERLASKQIANGSVDGVTQSIVGSGGKSLRVEGTSLAALAWMRDKTYQSNVERSIRFLADSCKAGRYGSTQATILALRSILEYDKTSVKKRSFGSIAVFVDDKQIGEPVAFSDTTQDALKLPDLSSALGQGDHKVELRMTNGNPMPYSLAMNYSALTPQSSKNCAVDISVRLSDTKLSEGSSAEALVTVANTTEKPIPNPVAIVGVPGGMEVRHDQLKELVKKGTIHAYEVRGREVVLYWRNIDAKAKIDVPMSLIAVVPGTYTGPASRAYLYYTDEHKHWTDGVRVEIAPKVQVASKAHGGSR